MLISGLSLVTYGGDKTPESVVVEIEGESWVYPLKENRILEVEGRIGELKIELLDSQVFVTEAPCRDKLCIAKGKIDEPGEWIACLPNAVFIRIEGRRDSEIDAGPY